MKRSIGQVGPKIESLILEVRGQKVILDADLACIYGTVTKFLNRAVKRNARRFPSDFRFRLTPDETAHLRFHFGTSSRTHGGRRYPPYVFTEHGAIMTANVLNSPRAVEMSVFVVRAFVKMRFLLADTKDLARKLNEVEADLKSPLDVQEAAIVDILQRIMRILDPPPLPPEPPSPEIGFHVKEEATLGYGFNRKS
jgi:hypothetical protein